jgi:hypothetical protein
MYTHVNSSNNIVNQTNPPLTTYKAQQRILNIERQEMTYARTNLDSS